MNMIHLTDSYKVSHWKQLPPKTNTIFSFFESRGGKFPETVFYGLQYYLMQYLEGQVVTEENIEEAMDDFELHFGDSTIYNREGWKHILKVHGGRLPILIRAVKEGTVVPTRNVLMTVESTDPQVPWVTNYVEGLLSMLWYTTTVATQSREMKKVILKYLEETGTPELVDMKLHDFGFRGSTSVESAGLGGSAHLTSFRGTDNLPALRVARKYYNERMAGVSIPAAEHMTITSWGRLGERDAYENMLKQFPTGFVAVVSDSYDIFHATRHIWGEQLRDRVLERDGVLVVRPDSGNPPDVVLEVLRLLGEAFGYTVNNKGYKVLCDKVRVIQGDGIDYEMIGIILERMKEEGWSADNIAFGSGGGLLQKVNRDTQKFAFKCSAVRIEDTWHDVIKDPITDPGKRSKAGRLALVQVETEHDAEYRTMCVEDAKRAGLENLLVPVFENGTILSKTTFAEIRERAKLV